MADDPPERINVSLPDSDPLDLEEIEEAVAESDCNSRSEWVREQLRSTLDVDRDPDD